jgi:hypothetical protein
MIFRNPFSTATQTATSGVMQGMPAFQIRLTQRWLARAAKWADSQLFSWDIFFYSILVGETRPSSPLWAMPSGSTKTPSPEV